MILFSEKDSHEEYEIVLFYKYNKYQSDFFKRIHNLFQDQLNFIDREIKNNKNLSILKNNNFYIAFNTSFSISGLTRTIDRNYIKAIVNYGSDLTIIEKHMISLNILKCLGRILEFYFFIWQHFESVQHILDYNNLFNFPYNSNERVAKIYFDRYGRQFANFWKKTLFQILFQYLHFIFNNLKTDKNSLNILNTNGRIDNKYGLPTLNTHDRLLEALMVRP